LIRIVAALRIPPCAPSVLKGDHVAEEVDGRDAKKTGDARPPGAEDGIRTRDLLLGKEMLYH